MGSEQSQPHNRNANGTNRTGSNSAGNSLNRAGSAGATHSRQIATNNTRLQRGNTISITGQNVNFDDGSPSSFRIDSRPVSPPISVCSDSDLPYISYTDKPIGDSPKLRNKGPAINRNVRSSLYETSRKPDINTGYNNKRPISKHNIVVVRPAAKEVGFEKDPEIQRIQGIPQFLPVMRGTLSLPANRDPEVLERLQPVHLSNICNRMQSHLNQCASKVASDQAFVNAKIKEVDYETNKVLANMVEKQKLHAQYAETFSKVRNISQQLSRCNTLLNQNIESVQTLNNFLDAENRLEPFVWTTATTTTINS